MLRLRDYTERRGVRTLCVHGKGSKLRNIPVHPKAVATIAEYLQEAGHKNNPDAPLFIPSPTLSKRTIPMLRQRIRELVARYAKRLHLPQAIVRPHALRATAATNALEHGADIAKVQDWLGHANPATTRLYDKRKDRPEESPTFRVMY